MTIIIFFISATFQTLTVCGRVLTALEHFEVKCESLLIGYTFLCLFLREFFTKMGKQAAGEVVKKGRVKHLHSFEAS